MPKPKALLSWSSGKDSAWTLHAVRTAGECEIVGLLTTLNREADRVAMHGVRREILERQADAAGLPLYPVDLPSPCSNDDYERLLGGEIRRLQKSLGISQVIFGDLFLADIRAWREAQMAKLGIEPVFPLWQRNTHQLANQMLEAGLEAYISCVDSEQLDAAFSGRRFDREFLDVLPEEVDPLGENGEFHTVVIAGPMFSRLIPVARGDRHDDGRFVYTDFLPP